MPTARVGSIELYYEEHGSGPPLLCIMGFATDLAGWALQVPEFARHFRTIVFDNRGVGRSAKPAGAYTIHEMADDAAGLLDALGVARAHVLGLSMGGMIAQELALRHPARVAGLVLAATYPEPDAAIEETRTLLLTQMGGSLSAAGEVHIDVTALDPGTFFRHLLPVVFNPSFLMSNMDTLAQMFGASLQYGFSLEAIMSQLSAVLGHNASARLSTIAAPTLVITGDADRLVAPANSDALARAIPGAKLVRVPGGSHGFNIETPEVFNREVVGFLQGVALDAGAAR